MTTLEYIKDSSPPQFNSLGIFNDFNRTYDESTDFPKGTTYTLGGKFPLNNYLDLYEKTNTPHTLNDIPVKLTGFVNSCQEGKLGMYGACEITVEKLPTGGRKSRRRRNRRNKSRRFK